MIASGGVRTGLSKAIVLGAQAGGLAKPFLESAVEEIAAVVKLIEDLTAELQTAMFVTGSRTIDEFQETEYILLGDTREYIQ